MENVLTKCFENEIQNIEYEIGTKEYDKEFEKIHNKYRKRIKKTRENKVADRAIEIAKIGVPTVTYIYLFYKGLEFEEENTIGNNWVKNLINKIGK